MGCYPIQKKRQRSLPRINPGVMMDSRERVRRLIDRQPADRVALFDSFWWETERAFHLQGMPVGISPRDYFDFDIDGIGFGKGFDQSFRLPYRVLEEREEDILSIDEWGTVQREFKFHQTTPGLIEFAVKDRPTWEAEYKPRLAFDPEVSLNRQKIQAHYDFLRQEGIYATFAITEPFECTWRKVGPQRQLELMVDDPEWLLDMYEADTALVEAAWQEMWSWGIQPDALFIYGDIAYRHSMLFSPGHYRRFLLPFHRRLCDLAHRFGAQVIYHTDGNLSKAIPLLLEAGIDCLQPIEVKAGMDVVALKQQYGDRLAFMGNIDARLLQANDRPGIEAEIRRKVSAAMVGGGYIYHSDHSVPPGTTLETYQFTLDLVRQVGRY